MYFSQRKRPRISKNVEAKVENVFPFILACIGLQEFALFLFFQFVPVAVL